jgi:subtilisin family serine protease
MARLDPRLRFIRQQRNTVTATFETRARFGILPESDEGESPIRVLLHFAGDLAAAHAAGFRPTTVAGDVAAGVTTFAALDELEQVENVTVIASSRPMQRELNVSLGEVGADRLHSATPSCRGAGVIVGIIDSGIDFRHGCFRDPAGNTRILAIWDQHLSPRAGESSPQPFGYGVEYTRAAIDGALAGGGSVGHVDYDPNGHGTHVAGIVAGNGSVAGNGFEAGAFVGVAPEADLVVVANQGDSAATLDAVAYLLQTAARLERPIAINLSQGDNLGPHDGSSELERGIDQLLGGPGVALVKSAGNAADTGTHARGAVEQDAMVAVPFAVPTFDESPDTIDVWYGGNDAMEMAIRTPGGKLSRLVRPGDPPTKLPLPNGNRVWVESSIGSPLNGDNQIYVQLLPGARPEIEPGEWELVLRGVVITGDGRFDAWIEPAGVFPRFLPPFVASECTITNPGTSSKVITVGAYVTVSSLVKKGSLAAFSSRGPSRDGRRKPDLSAPGQRVTSTRVMDGTSKDPYRAESGTSMAAPHVTGTIALLLEKRRSLTQGEILAHLTQTARLDVFTSNPPDPDWGAGKLDARECYAAVSEGS